MLHPYIIHNSKNIARFQGLKAQINEQNISELTILPAIMLEDPVTGCAESHKSVIIRSKAQKLPFVTIFEDDIKFTCPGAWDFFNMVFEEYLPKDWDIFVGGVYFSTELQDVPFNDHVKRIPKKFSSTHCIVLRDTVYDHVLSCPAGKHFDEWLSQLCGSKNVYLCWPMPAIQSAGYSDIAGKEVDYSAMLKNFKLLDSK